MTFVDGLRVGPVTTALACSLSHRPPLSFHALTRAQPSAAPPNARLLLSAWLESARERAQPGPSTQPAPQ